MKHINIYINEAWNGVKKQSLKADIEAWCDEMGIEDYTINSKSEIDVNGGVDLMYNDFKELPYKFGKIKGYFDVSNNRNLTSLKNCPNEVNRSFACDSCPKLDSLEGCPTKVGGDFHCYKCKKQFTKEEVESLCKVKENVYIIR